MIKVIIPVILLFVFQNILGQSNTKQMPEMELMKALANSDLDAVIRIDHDMNEEQLKSRIDILHRFNKNIEIEYTRDESGNIKTLTSSGGKSAGSCQSDDFGFLLITLQDNHWSGCMISGKK